VPVSCISRISRFSLPDPIQKRPDFSLFSHNFLQFFSPSALSVSSAVNQKQSNQKRTKPGTKSNRNRTARTTSSTSTSPSGTKSNQKRIKSEPNPERFRTIGTKLVATHCKHRATVPQKIRLNNFFRIRHFYPERSATSGA
jgi:hypothetical protein